MGDTRAFRAGPDVVAQRLGDQMVVVHLSTNIIFELNETASRIWELMGEGCDLTEIARRLTDHFNISEASAHNESVALFASLESHNLVVPC